MQPAMRDESILAVITAVCSGQKYSSSERQNWSTIMKMYLFPESLVVNGLNPYLDGLVHRVPPA